MELPSGSAATEKVVLARSSGFSGVGTSLVKARQLKRI